jgi:hypothetical protein
MGIVTTRLGVTTAEGEIFPLYDLEIEVVSRDAFGGITEQTATRGSRTWVQTIERDAEGFITKVNQWTEQ